MAVIAGTITLVVALIGLWGARKYNIGPNQEKLVMTLKDIVAAQNIRIEQLENQASTNASLIKDMQLQIDKLTKLTITQALKISDLEGRAKGG